MSFIVSILDYQSILYFMERAFCNRFPPNERDGKARMIGILFAPPHTPIAKDEIIPSIDYFYYRSGNYFDLFCVGYSHDLNHAKASYPDLQEVSTKDILWGYSNIAFNEVRTILERETSWKYSGEVDLILATARYNTQEFDSVSIDYTDGLVFDLDKMIRDEAIYSVRRLFEEIVQFTEQTDSDYPTTEFSDKTSIRIIGENFMESLIKFLPDAISNLLKKGWLQGRHFQTLQLNQDQRPVLIQDLPVFWQLKKLGSSGEREKITILLVENIYMAYFLSSILGTTDWSLVENFQVFSLESSIQSIPNLQLIRNELGLNVIGVIDLEASINIPHDLIFPLIPLPGNKSPEKTLMEVANQQYEKLAKGLALDTQTLRTALADPSLQDHHNWIDQLCNRLKLHEFRLINSIIEIWSETKEGNAQLKEFISKLHFYSGNISKHDSVRAWRSKSAGTTP